MSMLGSDAYGSWKELPTADVVYDWLRMRARLQASIRSISLDIAIEEARLTQLKPRDKAIRVTGLEGHTVILDLRRSLSIEQSKLDEVEADIKMFEFRKDVFKSLAFKERM